MHQPSSLFNVIEFQSEFIIQPQIETKFYVVIVIAITY